MDYTHGRLTDLAFRDIKVLGKSETLLNYRVEYIGEMSAFVQAGNPTSRVFPACVSLQLKSVLSSRFYFTVAVAAVYRFVTARLEGYLGLFAA